MNDVLENVIQNLELVKQLCHTKAVYLVDQQIAVLNGLREKKDAPLEAEI